MPSAANIVNPKDVSFLVENFSIFKEIHLKYGAPPNWQRPEGFDTLVLIILEQQVSLSSAKAHYAKLKGFVKEITPENILKLTDQEFRDNHISRQKTTYLRALATAVINKDLQLEHLKNLNEEQLRFQLTNIKGIGNWTADVYLMSCLQFKDIFPLGDIALVNTLKKLTNLTDKEEMLAFSNQWKPLRSLATYFFWHHYLSAKK